jgi:hypothetical protein
LAVVVGVEADGIVVPAVAPPFIVDALAAPQVVPGGVKPFLPDEHRIGSPVGDVGEADSAGANWLQRPIKAVLA